MAAGRLTFGETVSESFGFFFGNLALFFHVVTIPWIMSLVIRLGGAFLVGDSVLWVMAEKAVDALPTVMFVVCWQRIVLLGPRGFDRLPGLGWSPRESAFLVHLLKVAGMTFVLMVLFMFTVGPVDPAELRAGAATDPEMARRLALGGPLAFGFIVSLLLALRVSFGLAGTSVDIPFAPRQSWQYSRGVAWTVIAALFFVYFGGAFVVAMAHLLTLGVLGGFGGQYGALLGAWTVSTLVAYGVIGLTATMQAVIFRQLTGWRAGAPLPAVAEN